MEKLQAALAKARDKRAGLTDRNTPSAKPRRALKSEEAWSALKSVELSPKVLSAHRIISQDAGQAANSFDILRTKVLLQMQQNNWRRLAITSPGSGSGKTTMACNLALGLGRQSNLRTILFDFDLGDPSIHEFFGLSRPHTLADVLAGRIPFEELALRVGDNVAVVLSPVAEADPTRLLLSDEIGVFLDEMQQIYAPDVMIFDLPAILSGDRARAFLRQSDCALIVAMSGRTRFSHFDSCEREVAESTNVLGAVMNGCHAAAMPVDDV